MTLGRYFRNCSFFGENSMAKMTAGLAENLLLSVVRAWDTTGEMEGSRKKRIILAAIKTAIWRHPLPLI